MIFLKNEIDEILEYLVQHRILKNLPKKYYIGDHMYNIYNQVEDLPAVIQVYYCHC